MKLRAYSICNQAELVERYNEDVKLALEAMYSVLRVWTKLAIRVDVHPSTYGFNFDYFTLNIIRELDVKDYTFSCFFTPWLIQHPNKGLNDAWLDRRRGIMWSRVSALDPAGSWPAVVHENQHMFWLIPDD